MTWQQLAEAELPECTPDEAGWVLWNETAFPCTTELTFIVSQLRNARNRGLWYRGSLDWEWDIS